MANKRDVTWEDIEDRVIQPALNIAEDPSMSKDEKVKAMAEKGLVGMESWHFYGLTKACVSTYTFSLSNKYPNIIMNSCSPGYIETDLTRPNPTGKKPDGILPVEKGTISSIHLLMDDVQGRGWYYGSDAKRSPMHKSRNPGEPEYKGEFP